MPQTVCVEYLLLEGSVRGWGMSETEKKSELVTIVKNDSILGGKDFGLYITHMRVR